MARGTDVIRPSNKSSLVVAPVCLFCWQGTRGMLYQVSQCLMSRLTQARGWPAPEMAVISDTGGARGDHPVISSHIEREPAPGTVISSISTIRTGFRTHWVTHWGEEGHCQVWVLTPWWVVHFADMRLWLDVTDALRPSSSTQMTFGTWIFQFGQLTMELWSFIGGV